MPFIRIDVFEGELTNNQSKELISKVTDSVLAVTDEKLRDATWVIINEVKDDYWGVGGKALTLGDVKKMIEAD